MPTAHSSQIDQVCEKVERLLLKYQESQRTNGLLQARVETLAHERDSLRARLGAARIRIDALLERLPTTSDTAAEGVGGSEFGASPRTEERS